MPDRTVLLDIREDVAHIVLNRPEAMNALQSSRRSKATRQVAG
jgi:enoyl-CoA hydratase/carnithine racemase